MSAENANSAPRQWPIESRAAFMAALHAAVDQAVTQGAQRMVWVDSDFSDWPLDHPVLLLRLTDWLCQPQRQLLLLAVDFDDLPRRHARFVAWYRLWSHAVHAFSPGPEARTDLPCVLWAERAALVYLVDTVHWRGWTVTDALQQRQWRDRIDAILQRSEPAFPATTLGL